MSIYGQLIQFGPYQSGGVLYSGLRVYHYVVGTTTLKDVYLDREKSSTAAQPVQSDANGIVSFYADGLYKFRIDGSTDGSTYTTLYTYDKWAVGDFGTQTGEGAALTAASTLTLGTDGDFFHVTGSTGITALSGTQSSVTLVFDSTPTLTNSGNLILQYGASVTVAANMAMVFANDGAGVWREVSRTPPVSPLGMARQVLRVNAGATATEWANHLTLATPQVSTSGTSINFTGIPAGVRRITISFIGVSTNGTDPWVLHLGDAGGFEGGGYMSACTTLGATTLATSNANTAFLLGEPASASAVISGTVTLTLENAATFMWSCTGVLARSDTTSVMVSAGSKATSAVLDSLNITTASGLNTFDLGEINIAYE